MEATHFATYGTIRDDDDSGSDWTAPFLRGLVSARSGTVHGYQMWRNSRDNYPWALRTGREGDVVCVRLLSFGTDAFKQKLAEADEIEGYTPDGKGLYDRTSVSVVLSPASAAGAGGEAAGAPRADGQERETGVFYFTHALPAMKEGEFTPETDRFTDTAGVRWRLDVAGDWMKRDRSPEWFYQ